MLEDSYKHKGLRKNLVKVIQEKGFQDENVLNAINRVPRHLFMENAFLKYAYQDSAFPIAAGQTISQPFTVAVQTGLLNLKKGEKVLEIGTGSGYQTAVLQEMGAKIFTIERQKELYDKTKTLLPKMGYRPKFFYGDGYKGLPAFAPFDKILVTAGAPFIPEELKDQLKIGGLLVIPVGSEVQTMMVLRKISGTEYEEQKHGDFRFVPLLENRDW